ncbi:MAG: molybdopterin-dependent oxidoreductase, partial [Pseudomonadota bacterium]|nr:molybdopterin-dependent oxidoreductase [Pseudomonadota bacterium]
MGRARLEYQYHPERLRQPLKRVGERGEGKWQAISWEEAIGLFVENRKRISEQYGPRSVVFTSVSGAYGALTRGAPMRYAALTGATVQGLGGIDYGVATGLGYMFNVPAVYIYGPAGHSLDDVENSEITVIWGGNPAVTRSVDHVALKRAQRKGTKLICVDPVRSETARFCDEWISIRPGSDGALALSMVHEIIANGIYDQEFLLDYTNMPFLVDRNSGDLLREKDIVAGGTEEYLVWNAQKNNPIVVSQTNSPMLRWSGEIRRVSGSIAPAASVFELVAELGASFAPEVAEKITELPADTIRAFARQYAQASPAAIRLGYGIDRWYNSDVTARAIATL